MAKEGAHKHALHMDNPLLGSVGGMMHLFDFNEALLGRRTLEARRSTDGLESLTSFRNYPRDLSTHPSTKNELIKPENKVPQMPSLGKKKTQTMQMKELLDMESAESQRVPSVVARLMGLDTFPSESLANIQQKAVKGGSMLNRSLSDKPLQKAKQRPDSHFFPKQLPVQSKQCTRDPSYSRNAQDFIPNEKVPFEHQGKKLQGTKEKVIANEAWRQSQVMELEEMKRQLALKQILVSEKLNEAKRLLTGERLVDCKWAATQYKPTESKWDVGSKEYLRSGKYVDKKDTLASKLFQEHFPVKSMQFISKKPSTSLKPHRMEEIPDAFVRSPRSEVPGRPIESRRHTDFNILTGKDKGAKPFQKEWAVPRQSGSLTEKASISESHYKGTDWNFTKEKDSGIASGKTSRPTRIVVLKPSPHVQYSDSFVDPVYAQSHSSEPVRSGAAFLDKRLRKHRESTHEDPREIAREIARQVREKVVQELARKAKRGGSGGALNRKAEATEKIVIPISNHVDTLNAEIEELKSYRKGVAALNKFEEVDDYSTTSREGTMSPERYMVAPLDDDRADDKIVVRLQKKLSGHSSSALSSQDSEISNTGDPNSASLFSKQVNAGHLTGHTESNINSIQCVGGNVLQCTGESKVSLPTSLGSWPPLNNSVQGDTAETLERDTENRNGSGNVMVQDKGLIFEQLTASDSHMPSNVGDKSLQREEDTELEGAYVLSKLKSQSENFETIASSTLDSSPLQHHVDMTQACCRINPPNVAPIEKQKNHNEITRDSDAYALTVSSLQPSLKCSADTDIPDVTAESPLKDYQCLPIITSQPPQNIIHMPEEDEFQPHTDESNMVLSEEDTTDQSDCTMMHEDFVIGSDGSEISDDPSPNSVLVSSFEGSPNHANLNAADSDLKELPMHLQILKWDQNSLHLDETHKTMDMKVEGRGRKTDNSPPSIRSKSYLNGDLMSCFSCNHSPQCEYTHFQMEDIGCPEGKQEDLYYVGNLLNASGFTGRKESYFTKWHSPKHALDPSLFQRLENRYFAVVHDVGSVPGPSNIFRATDAENMKSSKNSLPRSTQTDSLHRHLLFDMVDDILLHKLKSHLNHQPWFRPARLMDILLPSGRQLLKEIWAQLCIFYEQHDGKASIARPERCLAKLDQWVEIQEEVQRLVFEVEQIVFTDLMAEVVTICTSLKSF